MTFNKRAGVAGLTLVFGVLALVLVQGQAKPMCDPDNGGITLPMGFCALVVADNLGAARHMAVAPNGDLYVALHDERRPRCSRRPAAARSPCATRTATDASR